MFKEKLSSKGLILLRLGNQSSNAKIKILEKLIRDYSGRFLGNFVVVSENKIRVRKI